MRGNADILTSAQGWLRDYSDLLSASFKSSRRIQHNVTKGQSREHQILDVLEKLLPTRVAVEHNAVIVDSQNVQSPKFDGALIDRMNWPRLFCDNCTTAVVLESVIATFETKSELNSNEMKDIFGKSKKLRDMVHIDSPRGSVPKVTAFAYSCPNKNLSFFDFCSLFLDQRFGSPSIICILNDAVFLFAKINEGRFVLADEIDKDSYPVCFASGNDSLLVYLYLLCQCVTDDPINMRLFRRYIDTVLGGGSAFYFDLDFLEKIGEDLNARNKARECFLRKSKVALSSLYGDARCSLSLSDKSGESA